MSVKSKTPKDKVYRLLSANPPLSYTLPSRNHPRFPLMWYDEAKNENRALRYSTNQKSPFEDEQDGNAILEPIVFEDGLLTAYKSNPVLQLFLHYHPFNGTVFAELDKEKDAQQEFDVLNNEVEAMIAARELSIEQVEIMTRVLFGKDPSMVSSAELKRDILIFAKQSPTDFINVLNDPELNYHGEIRAFFEKGLLSTRNNDKEVWFNTPTNKRKMMMVPFNESPQNAAAQFLKSEEGADALNMLKAMLEM
jgi:hypothetical protein